MHVICIYAYICILAQQALRLYTDLQVGVVHNGASAVAVYGHGLHVPHQWVSLCL